MSTGFRLSEPQRRSIIQESCMPCLSIPNFKFDGAFGCATCAVDNCAEEGVLPVDDPTAYINRSNRVGIGLTYILDAVSGC